MKTKVWFLVFAMVLCETVPAMARPAGADEPGVALTIYNDNFGVVKERRFMQFERGLTTVRFTDVATAIDPTSVNFKCLSAPDTVSILEQNYEYDLMNTHSLLQRYLDKEVTVFIKGSGSDPGTRISGVLSASMGSDMILWDKAADQMMVITRDSIERIQLTQRPGDLVTKPTLVWLAQSGASGQELCQVTYTTEAISWKADYSAVLNENEDALDLSGWVTIDNKSGAGYSNAAIKLIAGDVRRIVERPTYPAGRGMMMEKMAFDDSRGFEEKAFMEYHLYTLGRTSTINNNQVKQIELIDPAENVPVKKLFVYEWQKKADKVQVKLEFENREENGLGIALPKGKVRVFKKDPADESLEFVGEDEIDHTPRKEKLSLYIGDAFDIAVEHKVTDSKQGRRQRTETHEVELRNRKDEAVEVFVDHQFGMYVDWKMDSASQDYEKRDARTVRFKVHVPADETVTLTFTATEYWQ